MKYMFYVALLSIALPVFLFAAPGTQGPEIPSAVTAGVPQNDNQDRRRRRGRDDSDRSRHNSNRTESSSSAEARRSALRAVPGTIVKEEFEQRNGRSIFEFYIRKNNGEVFEVYVDAETNEVIKIERRTR
jgi:uncharacterized membrane protein YkoI